MNLDSVGESEPHFHFCSTSHSHFSSEKGGSLDTFSVSFTIWTRGEIKRFLCWQNFLLLNILLSFTKRTFFCNFNLEPIPPIELIGVNYLDLEWHLEGEMTSHPSSTFLQSVALPHKIWKLRLRYPVEVVSYSLVDEESWVVDVIVSSSVHSGDLPEETGRESNIFGVLRLTRKTFTLSLTILPYDKSILWTGRGRKK